MDETVEITKRQHWETCLEAARLKNAELKARDFHWTVVSAIEGRLDALSAGVARGDTPTIHDRERGIGLGVIAVRSIFAADKEYCRLLLALANAFDGWPQKPQD